ncbi:MAG: PAC2 family protein [Aeromicrobium erythreum]
MSDVDIPAMNDPWVVAAFEGWNDAADAATSVVDHLVEAWDAEMLTQLDPEDYYSYTDTRPQMRLDDEGHRRLVWPTPTIWHAKPPHSERHVLLLRAPEPNLRWRHFCSTVLGVARLAGATDVVTMGALLADVPHTRPVPVSGSSTDAALAERLGLHPSTYLGPVGITAALTEAAADAGLASLSLWAAVPHYLAEPPCPKATLALLGALEDALGFPLPQGDLEDLSNAWQRGAEEAVNEDPDVAEYVQELEQERDAGELPGASGDDIAREFERYLRRRDPGT